jgi:hypothetical protein
MKSLSFTQNIRISQRKYIKIYLIMIKIELQINVSQIHDVINLTQVIL